MTNPKHIDLLKQAYAAFNARDIETVLALMHPDVAWANGMEGGHVYGRGAVRSYWEHQWTLVDPHVDPIKFQDGENGQIVTQVHQVVHDLAGNLLLDQGVQHIYSMQDDLIRRMDIR